MVNEEYIEEQEDEANMQFEESPVNDEEDTVDGVDDEIITLSDKESVNEEFNPDENNNILEIYDEGDNNNNSLEEQDYEQTNIWMIVILKYKNKLERMIYTTKTVFLRICYILMK